VDHFAFREAIPAPTAVSRISQITADIAESAEALRIAAEHAAVLQTGFVGNHVSTIKANSSNWIDYLRTCHVFRGSTDPPSLSDLGRVHDRIAGEVAADPAEGQLDVDLAQGHVQT
jgi:hypothetical protein